LNPKSKKKSADTDLENRVLKPTKLSCAAARRALAAKLRVAQAAAGLRVVLLLLMSGMAQAGTRWWDGGTSDIVTNGTGDSAGGAGTWNTMLRNWDQGNGLSHVAWTNANNDTAIWGGTAGTVTLGTGITVGGLVFNTASYVLDGSNQTFGVSGTISNSGLATVSSVIAWAASLTKTGSGTLTLGRANTYSGNTYASAGIHDFSSISLGGFGGGSGINISVVTGAGVRRSTLDNAFLNQVEAVAVVLSPGLLTNTKLFIRLRAAP
jgi:autotransporter-associated beta strand protein